VEDCSNKEWWKYSLTSHQIGEVEGSFTSSLQEFRSKSPLYQPKILARLNGGLQTPEKTRIDCIFQGNAWDKLNLYGPSLFFVFLFVSFWYEFVALVVARWWQIDGDEFVYSYILIYACCMYIYFYMCFKDILYTYLFIVNIPNLNVVCLLKVGFWPERTQLLPIWKVELYKYVLHCNHVCLIKFVMQSIYD